MSYRVQTNNFIKKIVSNYTKMYPGVVCIISNNIFHFLASWVHWITQKKKKQKHETHTSTHTRIWHWCYEKKSRACSTLIEPISNYLTTNFIIINRNTSASPHPNKIHKEHWDCNECFESSELGNRSNAVRTCHRFTISTTYCAQFNVWDFLCSNHFHLNGW